MNWKTHIPRLINARLTGLWLLIFHFGPWMQSNAQQDPQYTMHMYNTQVVNPAYLGSTEAVHFGFLTRSQWVDFEGSPQTGSFTISSPVGRRNKTALGLSIVSDVIGPTTEQSLTADYGYTFYNDYGSKITLGLKAGVSNLQVDYSILNLANTSDEQFSENTSLLSPQIGAGIYYNNDRFYAGFSVPNFLKTKHYEVNGSVFASAEAKERMHYFLIAGYVFDINDAIKLKPAGMVKIVRGSPIQMDLSANIYFNEKITFGAAYRLDAAISAIAGFALSDRAFVGFAYDYQTTAIQQFSSGSYEMILRFTIPRKGERILTPRFF
jgi:type IX secretion system PorP/SprF family membrane protein